MTTDVARALADCLPSRALGLLVAVVKLAPTKWSDGLDADEREVFATMAAAAEKLLAMQTPSPRPKPSHPAMRELFNLSRYFDLVGSFPSERRAYTRATATADDGVGRIYVERMRQITSEGWSDAHDDEWEEGQLALAAISYALSNFDGFADDETPPAFWSFDADWWKPSDDPVRNLVKAGALIAAKIDRLNRLAGGDQQ